MKVLTIFTGGTIGSRIDGKGRITTVAADVESFPYILLAAYQNQYHDDTEFIVDVPYCILSENLSAEYLRKLIRCVEEGIQREDIDGIVITHGTDTLAYSAALLGYLFGNTGLPILLVSSDYPLEDKRANGFENFHYALEFIEGGHGSGVFVSYCNKGGVPLIHRGTRLLQQPPFSADVVSVCDAWYGRFEHGRYVPNPDYRVREGMPSLFENTQTSVLSDDASEIIRIASYVGMTYPKLLEGTRAVFLESFHSGTIAINEELKRFMDRANELEIPVFLTGLSQTEAEYETVYQYRAMGIHPLCESAPIAQYCKLWLAISNGIDGAGLEKIMNCSVAEDFV